MARASVEDFRQKRVSIKDFLTPKEIKAAIKLYAEALPGTFARRCDLEIIQPVIGRINQALGQQNDSRFLAYMVEHTLNTAGERK